MINHAQNDVILLFGATSPPSASCERETAHSVAATFLDATLLPSPAPTGKGAIPKLAPSE